jgi:acyl carrier protein phosphodiesterase
VNHLGHIWVARRTGTSVVGGILGDFVKGDPARDWNGELLEGIRLHRRVDRFTDAHPAFRRARDRLRPRLGRWAGVVVDILWDHVLARDWPAFDETPLRAVADGAYAELTASLPILPPRMTRFVAYALQTDVFMAYGTREGIGQVLRGVSGRVRRDNPIAEGADELDRQGDALAADFREFAADLASKLDTDRLAT